MNPTIIATMAALLLIGMAVPAFAQTGNLTSQIERTIEGFKTNQTDPEFNARMKRMTGSMMELVAPCSNPLSSGLPLSYYESGGQCDVFMTVIGLACQVDTLRKEIFECANPAISTYLEDRGITDPEANLQYLIDRAKFMNQTTDSNMK